MVKTVAPRNPIVLNTQSNSPPLPRIFQPEYRRAQQQRAIQLRQQEAAQAEYDSQVEAERLRVEADQSRVARDESLARKYREGTLSREEFTEIFGNQFESKYGKNSSDALSFAFKKYKVSSGQNLSSDEIRNFAISGGIIGRDIRKELGGGLSIVQYQKKLPFEVPLGGSVEFGKAGTSPIINDPRKVPSQQKLVIGGEPVIYTYRSNEGNVLVTTGGRELVEKNKSFLKNLTSNGSTRELSSDRVLSIQELFALRSAVPVSVLKDQSGGSIFVDKKEVGGVLAKGIVPSLSIREKQSQDFFANQAMGGNFLTGKASLPAADNVDVTSPLIPIGNVAKKFYDNQTTQDFLSGSKMVSEFAYREGSGVFRGIAETGRSIGKGVYESTGIVQDYDRDGVPTLRIASTSERAAIARGEFDRVISDKDFPQYRERQAILGGTLVSLIPYTIGGPITSIQKVSDLGAAFKVDPGQSVNLIQVGVASSVLFNQLGGVGRLVKGQLGGSIAGSVGFAKTFENVTSIGGKALGVGLLVPYAAQEFSPLYQSFQEGNATRFGESLAGIQRTRASIEFGSKIGQNISTGFTAFAGTRYAITSGGLNAPTETLARKRLIANVFDAKPGTMARVDGKDIDVYTIRQTYEKEGFTKQKFIESYDSVFNKLNTAKVTVNEFNPGKLEVLTDNVKAQRAVSKYFAQNSGEFRIYGSTVQGPQLPGVTIRKSGDVDLLAKNPEKFLTGLRESLVKSGIPRKDLGLFVGAEKSSLSIRGEKGFNVQDLAKDKAFFTQIENVAGVIPKRVFVQTTSGINLSNIRFQAGRKVVGGFVDLREKDIRDVSVITKGVKNIIKSNSIASTSNIGDDFFRFGASRRESRLASELGEKYIAPVFSGKEYFEKIIKPTTLGFGRNNPRDIQRVNLSQQARDFSTGSSTGSARDFRITDRGFNIIQSNLSTADKGIRVKDVAVIGRESQPIKDISSITGVSPNRLVKRFQNIRLEQIPSEQIAKDPFIGAKFGTDAVTGRPAIAVRQFKDRLSTESAIVHELEHAGERIAGITSGRPLTRFDYFTSGSERRAFAVQERFLESRGRTLPSDILFSTGVKGDSSLITRVTQTNDTPKLLGVDLKSVYSQAFRTSTRKTSVSKLDDYSNYYSAPKKLNSSYYIPTKPVQQRPSVYPTVTPYKGRDITYTRSPTVLPDKYVPPTPRTPYRIVSRNQNIPYTPNAPPAVPPYSPPRISIPPVIPPIIIPPTRYIPPGSPPGIIGPPVLTRTRIPSQFVRNKRLSRGFLPVLYRRGKPVRSLYGEPLTAKDALAVGSSFVQGNIKRSFKLKPFGQAEDKGFKGPIGILRRGKRDKLLFVERSQFAINTPGEKGALRYGREQSESRLLRGNALRGLI